jgi:hypothetical protein
VLATLRALNERHSVPFVEQLSRAQSGLSSASGSAPSGARSSAAAGSSRDAARGPGQAAAEYSFEQFVEHFDVDDKLVQRVVETMIKVSDLSGLDWPLAIQSLTYPHFCRRLLCRRTSP